MATRLFPNYFGVSGLDNVVVSIALCMMHRSDVSPSVYLSVCSFKVLLRATVAAGRVSRCRHAVPAVCSCPTTRTARPTMTLSRSTRTASTSNHSVTTTTTAPLRRPPRMTQLSATTGGTLDLPHHKSRLRPGTYSGHFTPSKTPIHIIVSRTVAVLCWGRGHRPPNLCQAPNFFPG